MKVTLTSCLLGLLLGSSSAALAAPPSGTEVQKALDSNSSWDVVKLDARGGVDVYKKDIAGFELPGFKGLKTVDVDSGVLFEAINDFDAHNGLSDQIPLVRSRVLKRVGNTVHVFAYLDVPNWTLANDRFWFVEATMNYNVGGVEGHHKQTWRKLDASLYPEVLKEALSISSKAVLVELNYGSWEVIPEGGKTRLTVEVHTDPMGTGVYREIQPPWAHGPGDPRRWAARER